MIRFDRYGKPKGTRLFSAVLLAAVWLFALHPPASAQQAGPGKVPLVSFAEITGTPGASLMVPFYFTPDPQKPLRSIAVDLEFVSNNLKFQKASRGAASEQAGVEIATDVTEAKPDDKGITRSTLHVEAALTEANSKQGLPDGLLAYLLFQISLDAKPFAIKLTPKVTAAEDLATPPKKVDVAQVGAEPGLVVVQVLDVMPEATCSFFTH